MGIPEETINEIQDRLDMVDVVGEYVQLKKAGGRYMGLCPFHHEKTPSFSVNREKKLFYCFGCHKGGTLFSFIMEMEKLSFPESVRLLAKKAGVELQEYEEGKGAEEWSSLRGTLIDLHRRVTNSYHYILLSRDEGKPALEYLLRRGISRDTIENFRIGYAPAQPDWLYKFLIKRNYSDEFLEKTGLFTRKNPRRSLFTGRIIFPIQDMKGNTVAFGGRSLKDEGPKYINSPDTPIYRKKSYMYGLAQALESIRKEDRCIVVEGYLDVLAMHQAGIQSAVAPLGTSLTREQVLCIRRFARSCVLVFDGDEAGLKAAGRAGALCENLELENSIVELPAGSDPAEILEKEGPEALQILVKYPINTFEYLVKKAGESYRTSSSAERSGILGELYSFIGSASSEVRKEEYLTFLADELGLSYHSVTGDFEGSQDKSWKSTGDNKEKRSRDVSFDLFLLLAVTDHRSYFPYVRSRLTPEDFEDTRGKELFIALEECYRQDEESMEKLLEKVDNEELKEIIIEKINNEEFNINVDTLIHDGVERIKERSLLKKREEIERSLRKNRSQGGDLEEERKLIAEKVYLDKELSRYKG